MLSRRLNLALRLLPHPALTNIIANSSTVAVEHVTIYDRNPAPYFFNQEVQELLQILTRPNPEKVFRRRLDGTKINEPQYKFMTDEELQKAQRTSETQMWKLLQIPPIVSVREENIRILSKDPAVQGYTDTKHVFTDITFGISNKNRIIVVREPDGTLRTASCAERDRLNQIYFPIPGREIEIPKMFEDEHLQAVLDREDYEFILDRACIQFDPDSPFYHSVTQKTYDEVNKKQKHNKLRSTRHFGSMVFYLAWSKNLNNLLLENIENNKIEDAALAIKLYYIINPRKNYIKKTSSLEIIHDFIKYETNDNVKLVNAFETYKQILRENQRLHDTKELVHGRKEFSTDAIKESSSTEERKT